jgi:tetratricopeptide (TPR) repeat protein
MPTVTDYSSADVVRAHSAARLPDPRRLVADTLRDDIASALRRHQAGELEAAARLYQAILARDPDQADALHLLGVVRHQQRQSALAVELIGRAVALRPGAAAFHANLAEAYRSIGQLERAVGCCRTALLLHSDYPEARVNLGLALQGLGRHDEAVLAYQSALELRPNDAIAHTNLATALRALGQTDAALEHFGLAVTAQPGLALARTNLGQFLLDLGRPEDALPHCQEAVALAPDLAEAHNNLGNAHRALGRLVEARASYAEALRLNPKLGQAQANLALALQQEGRLDEALPWFRAAVELEPDSVLFLGHLADAAAERERTAEAIACFQRILEIEPDRTAAHNALGWHLQEEGRLDEAEERFRIALRLQPDFAPAHVSLGGLHEERGDLAVAEACFREALLHTPAHAPAHGRLATLLRGDLPDDDLAALQRRLDDPDLGDGPRADLLFGLAHVLDARAQYDEAADCLQRANALTAAAQRERKLAYDADEHRRFVEGLIAACDRAFCTRLAGAGLETRQPVFVFGLPRSGTTLIEQVLASHSQVHGAGELPLAREDFEAIPSILDRLDGPLMCLPDLEADAVHKLALRHEQRLRERVVHRSPRVVDKMPDNYLYLGLLAALFPRATFIHCRRDLRDVAVSCWITNFRSIRWADDPAHLGARFRDYLAIMDHWRGVLRATIHEVDYEDTVANLEGVAQRVVAACSLDWEPACLEFHRTRRPVRTASVTQVRQPVYSRSVARWKNYERSLAPLFEALPRAAQDY